MHHHARQILEVMVDDNVALCLTPQAFSNVHKGTDIFNNTNQQVLEGPCHWSGRGRRLAAAGRGACHRCPVASPGQSSAGGSQPPVNPTHT
jgi:hypothetical protein